MFIFSIFLLLLVHFFIILGAGLCNQLVLVTQHYAICSLERCYCCSPNGSLAKISQAEWMFVTSKIFLRNSMTTDLLGLGIKMPSPCCNPLWLLITVAMWLAFECLFKLTSTWVLLLSFIICEEVKLGSWNNPEQRTSPSKFLLIIFFNYSA